ncbi:MAG: hypothetical protein IH991_13670, partial [Planctomycetes bacterium]|nr:hypothetical protein [Planctomycetota bacterium]
MTNFCLLLAAGKISTWLTPVWILGLGFAVGAAVLLLLWGICFAASRIQVVGSILDNPKQCRWVGASISGAVFVSAIVFIIWPQISEWRKEGVGEAAVNIPLALVCWAALSTVVGFSCVALVSRKTVTEVPTAVREGVLFPFAILVAVMGTFGIVATFFIPEEPGKIIDSLLQFPATSLEYPQVAAIPLTAFCVVTFFLLYIVQQALMPRLSAIALATAKSEIGQPLFLILTAVAAALMLAFVYIPFYTL